MIKLWSLRYNNVRCGLLSSQRVNGIIGDNCVVIFNFLSMVYFRVLLQPWKVVYNHSPGPCHLVPPIGKTVTDNN